MTFPASCARALRDDTGIHPFHSDSSSSARFQPSILGIFRSSSLEGCVRLNDHAAAKRKSLVQK
jgi:hypothetical protein